MSDQTEYESLCPWCGQPNGTASIPYTSKAHPSCLFEVFKVPSFLATPPPAGGLEQKPGTKEE